MYNPGMPEFTQLAGVFAAALTPLRPDLSPAIEDIPILLDFLARRGCHGALLLGTTGEGPSFSTSERLDIWRAALEFQHSNPEFRLLAATGTPSLQETIDLNKQAFEVGIQTVVVLPPYYFRNASQEGLYEWFRLVLENSVPEGGQLLAYHIPPMTGLPLSLDLLARLKEEFPDRFAGLKDSSGEADFTRQLGERFGGELVVLNGTDRLFSLALENHATGCITALANLYSPYLRLVWEARQIGQSNWPAQALLDAARDVSEHYPPASPLLKAMLARQYGFPRWPVRPPLLPLTEAFVEQAAADMQAIDVRILE